VPISVLAAYVEGCLIMNCELT